MAAPVTIFYTPLSQPSRVVYWFCLVNKIPCKVTMIDMSKGEHLTPEFIAMNPFHTLPTLKDSDGTAVFESNAIVWYLREKYGDSQRLLPQGQHAELTTAARVQAFLSWYPVGLRLHLTSFVFPVAIAPLFMKAQPPPPDQVSKLLHKAKKAVQHVEDVWLANGWKYIAGSASPTLADFHAYSEMQSLRLARFDFGPFPNVRRFFATLATVPHRDTVFGPLDRVVLRVEQKQQQPQPAKPNL